jgi:hypothetical protein
VSHQEPGGGGSCRGRYHTDRQRGGTLQNTAMPPGPPPARSRTAWAGGQSHLHLHGATAEDVAAIIEPYRRDG